MPPEPCRSVFPETGSVNHGLWSARAGEPVVVGAVPASFAGLLRLLLGLGLHDVCLAGNGGSGVAVRLPVDLLGAAEQLLRLGLRLAPDAHRPILAQVIRRQTAAGRRPRFPVTGHA